MTCLFNFFIIFLNKTDGQTLNMKIRVYLFFFFGTEEVYTTTDVCRTDCTYARINALLARDRWPLTTGRQCDLLLPFQ